MNVVVLFSLLVADDVSAANPYDGKLCTRRRDRFYGVCWHQGRSRTGGLSHLANRGEFVCISALLLARTRR